MHGQHGQMEKWSLSINLGPETPNPCSGTTSTPQVIIKFSPEKRIQCLKVGLFFKIKELLFNFMRSSSNIEWKSSNNTYLNIIELLFFNIAFFSNLRIIELENLVITLTLENLTFKWEKNKWTLPLCKQRCHAELIQ